MPGRLIVLNGMSSSGKTSIARALQSRWDGPLLYLALDNAIGFLPFAYTGDGAAAAQGYHLIPETRDGEPVTRYAIGPLGHRLNAHLAALAQSLTDDGFDVVLDHVIADDATIRDLAAQVRVDSTWLIGITCDLSVAIHRERLRGDRAIGLARDQAGRVHAGLRPYDLMVDTSDSTPDAAAAQIADTVRDTTPGGLATIELPPG